MAKLIQDGPEYIPDSLIISGNLPLMPKGITIKQGVIAKRGAIIALERDSKKGVLADKSVDTQELFGILADDVDATDGDMITTVYTSGHFNEGDLSFAEGSNIEDFKVELRKLGIFLDTVKEVY